MGSRASGRDYTSTQAATHGIEHSDHEEAEGEKVGNGKLESGTQSNGW